MTCRRVKKRVKKEFTDTSLGLDYSNLPQQIKDNILVRLTTEEALRTCVLSKEWRYAWCTVPRLVIFEKDIIDEDSDYDCSEYVDLLLSNHKGTINEFTLFMDYPDFGDLDKWISVLGSKGLKDLSLSVSSINGPELPPSFFLCLLDLTNLELYGCHLEMPEEFKGFTLLCQIELGAVNFTKDGLEKLISRCPLLEDLKLVDEFDSLGNLVIRSQSLEKLRVFADFEHLLLETPRLFSFCISPEEFDHKDAKYKRVEGEYRANFIGFDKEPEIWCEFLVVCDISTTPRKLPIQLNHLIKMIIDIDLCNEGDHVAALCLFKSAPRLQDLHVKLHNERGLFSDGFWEPETGTDLFSCLKTVRVTSIGLGGATFVLEFVKFVLRTAPVLQNMYIKDLRAGSVMCTIKDPPFLEKVSQRKSFVMQMRSDMLAIFEVLKFHRLSNKATVEICEGCICDEHDEDPFS